MRTVFAILIIATSAPAFAESNADRHGMNVIEFYNRQGRVVRTETYSAQAIYGGNDPRVINLPQRRCARIVGADGNEQASNCDQ